MKDNWRDHFLGVLKAKCRKKLNFQEGDDYGLKTRTAKALNINPNIVSGWYRKSFPSPENLIQIYNVFGISPNELLGIETETKSKETAEGLRPSPPLADLTHLIGATGAGIETEDFLSFPIQTFGSTIETTDSFSGQVVIHKRVFGRRKNLAAVRLNGCKVTKIVIVGK
jgi:transcriptional regulator with XRE-family HTH domain